jgi:hypothetical protein
MFIGQRNESFAFLSLLLFFRIMEGCKIPEYGAGRSNDTMSSLSPPSRMIPSLLTGQSFCSYTVKECAETFVFFEHLKIINRVASCEVE